MCSSDLPGVWQLQAAAPGYVEATRRIDTSAPLTGGGDLSANRTLSIPAATGTADGYMTSTQAALVNGATAIDTASTLMLRDANQTTAIGALQVDTAPAAAITGGVGKVLWNNQDGTLEFQLKGGNVTLQIGEEQVIRVVNKTGVDIGDGVRLDAWMMKPPGFDATKKYPVLFYVYGEPWDQTVRTPGAARAGSGT